jgi:hypothetical protein
MNSQKITKTGLKELHSIACDAWKKKLIAIANREPFNDSIEISKDEIIEIFKASSESQLKVVKKYFTEYTIGGKVKSYEDACNSLSIDSTILRTKYEQLCIVIEGLNDGWKPDLNDTVQYKYYNYFKMEGGEFVFYGTSYYCSNLSVPSALYFKNEELAIYCKDTFFELYKSVYM